MLTYLETREIDAYDDTRISSLGLVVFSQNEFKKRRKYREFSPYLPLDLPPPSPEHTEHHHVDHLFHDLEGEG